jgi:hypothetical protein
VSVKFPPYESRETVAAMLEKPLRAASKAKWSSIDIAENLNDIDAILAELDRIDTVDQAKRQLASNRAAWERQVIATQVKTEDAPAGTLCVEKNYSSYSWSWSSKVHKAKVLLNGVGYCLTHLKNAERRAQSVATREARADYVYDAALRAIVDTRPAYWERIDGKDPGWPSIDGSPCWPAHSKTCRRNGCEHHKALGAK